MAKQKQKIAFDPKRYSKEVLTFLVAAAETWGCTPGEAQERILDELASKDEKEAA